MSSENGARLNKPCERDLINVATIQAKPGKMSSDKRVEKSADVNWHQSVWKVVSEIPSGHVLTYGEVARLSGMPRAARRVSQAMRRAPRAMQLPWHRVVNAQGKISFAEDSMGWKQQKSKLEDEGVIFLDGKIDLEQYGYRGAVDRLLWGDVSS
jgi:methylated-DNA-protein-cysteine methyltransferase-like protein